MRIKKSPTISDVARHAKVSIATVSRVLNGTTPVGNKTAKRVRTAIGRLNFMPRHAARVLASRRTNTIGLILDEIGRDFFSPLLRGIEAAAREARYDLLIKTTGSPHATLASIQALGQHNTDGLIVFIDSLNQNELARLHKNRFPLVLMHQTPPEELDIPIITIENKSGAQKLVEHLIEVHGCSRIVFLQGPEGNEDSEWRERGYLEALETHHIEFDPSLITSGGFDDKEAFNSIQQMLRDGIEMDAIFAGDDEAAVGVIRALKMEGRLIPTDIAVVGFDDVPFARHLSPALTTVRAPIEEVGREAVRQLVRLMNGQQADILTLMRTELVIRESCGCKCNESIQPQEELLLSTRR